MSPIEIKKLKLEIARVTTAKLDLEIRLEERLQEIEKIKEYIAVQETKETELNDKLSAASGN